MMSALDSVTGRCEEERAELIATLGPRQIRLFLAYERDLLLREEIRANTRTRGSEGGCEWDSDESPRKGRRKKLTARDLPF